MNEVVNVSGQWAGRLTEFNVHVARIAHRSWIPESVRPFVFNVQGALHPRAEKWISEWLLETHDLRREMDWQMKEPQKRIWLLDSPSLARLTRELSIVMHRNELMQTIDGVCLREIRSRVDPVLWRLMVEELPADAPCHAHAHVSFLNRVPQELEADLIEDGSRTLMALLRPEWRAVCGRARLRFAATRDDGQSAGIQGSDQDMTSTTWIAESGVMSFVCDWLVPRRLPQWAWLF